VELSDANFGASVAEFGADLSLAAELAGADEELAGGGVWQSVLE